MAFWLTVELLAFCDALALYQFILKYYTDNFSYLQHRLELDEQKNVEQTPVRSNNTLPFVVKRRINSYSSIKRDFRKMKFIIERIKEIAVQKASMEFCIPCRTLY